MSIGFTDRAGLDAPDRFRKVVVECRLVEARVKAVLVVDAAMVTAWLPRSEIAIEEGMAGRVRDHHAGVARRGEGAPGQGRRGAGGAGAVNAINLAPWALDDRMTIVLFAGMGGGCDGLEAAGFHVHAAVNHDPVAVAVHAVRHPHTRHLQSDVFEVDPREVTGGRGVRILHASPDCTHFSVAKGSKPVSKRRRSLAWVICRWLGQAEPEVVTLENVREIVTWGPLVARRDPATGRVLRLDGTVAKKGERVPVREQWLIPDPRHKGRIWRAFVRHVRSLGYSFEHRVLCCADYGVPTIRTRMFGVMRRDGGEISWPERTHAPRKDAKRLGLKPWVGAHTIIDWSLPVKSIFSRKKPLAEATLRRTARGVMRYVVEAAVPFIVPITHTRGSNEPRSVGEPLGTITTAKGGENMVAVPHVAKFRTGSSGADIEEPLATFTANSFETRPGGAVPLGLVSATIVKNNHGDVPYQDVTEPLHAVTTQGNKHAVIAANLVQLAHGDSGGRRESSLDEPAMTVHAGGGNQAFVATTLIQTGYGERAGQAPRTLDLAEPAGTQVAGGSKAALVAAFLAQHTAGSHPGQPAKDMAEPVPTILGAGSQTGVVAATLGNLHGTNADGRPIEEPLSTLAAGGTHAHLILAFLTHYFSSGKTADDVEAPLAALTGKVRHGLVTVTVDGVEHFIDDIGMRMLEPEEGAAAHGFAKGALPAEITIEGVRRRLTKTEKYHLVGNSVPPRMVQLLAEANGRRELDPAFRVAAE